MARQCVCKGILLVLVVLSKGQAQEATTEPGTPEPPRPRPPPPAPPVPLPPHNDSSSSSEENLSNVDLSVHPGWWFPPVQFEHVIVEMNDSDEMTNPDSVIIGGEISFVPLIISKDPPGTMYYYSYNGTSNGTDLANGTSFIEVEEAYMEISNNGSVEIDDFIVFPADDITAEILSPAMVIALENGTMPSTTVAPLETLTNTFNTTQMT